MRPETLSLISTISLFSVFLVNPGLGSTIFIHLVVGFLFFGLIFLLFMGIFLLIETFFKPW